MNKRHHPRIPLKLNATLANADIGSRAVMSLDISLGGASILSPFSLEIGTEFFFELDLPNGNVDSEFCAPSRIVANRTISSRDFCILGLRFDGLGSRYKLRLNRFIKQFSAPP